MNNTQKNKSRKRRNITGRLANGYLKAMSNTPGYTSYGYPFFR